MTLRKSTTQDTGFHKGVGWGGWRVTVIINNSTEMGDIRAHLHNGFPLYTDS